MDAFSANDRVLPSVHRYPEWIARMSAEAEEF